MATRLVHDCPEGRAVELYALYGNGHAWPGGAKGRRQGDEPVTAFDAAQVIWDFFASHPR